jgi:hypothetical protein
MSPITMPLVDSLEQLDHCAKQGNWDHVEVLPFIKCKKQEHVNFKPLVDPPSQMLSIAHK